MMAIDGCPLLLCKDVRRCSYRVARVKLDPCILHTEQFALDSPLTRKLMARRKNPEKVRVGSSDWLIPALPSIHGDQLHAYHR